MSSNGSIVAQVSLPIEAFTVVASPPDLVSQRNVEAVTGIPRATFLDLIRSSAFPLNVVKLGKLRLVERAAFVAWLLAGAVGWQIRTATKEASEVDPVDALAAELGIKRSARARKGAVR